MIDRIRNEPALVAGLIQAALGLAVAFGLDLTAEQTAGILAATGAALALFVRSSVTPTPSQPPDEQGAVDLSDVLTLALVALVVVVILVLVGVI